MMRPEKIVVTGAAGFIGSLLAENLWRSGFEVALVDQRPYFFDRPEIARWFSTLPKPTLIDRDDFRAALLAPDPEAVLGFKISQIFHLGACTRTTELNIAYLTQINVQYSQVVWNYCTENRIPLVYASSAATYGAGEAGYSDDEALLPTLKPLNPYGDSKHTFDLWALAQEKIGRTPPTWSGFKFFNVYGYRELHKGPMASVVHHATRQIRETGKAKLFKSDRAGIADGEQKRDFIYVGDLIEILLFAMKKPIKRGIFNCGTGRAQSFNELVLAVFAALELPPQIEWMDMPRHLSGRYQYFTQAEMQKLAKEGYPRDFANLREGVAMSVPKIIDSHPMQN